MEHHLSNIEKYLDTNTTGKTDVEGDDNGEPEVVTGSSAANFALFPMSETLQARMFAEFLSSFGKHPHVQNDSIKKALQNNMYRVLEIGSRTLAHHASLDPHIVACLVKVDTYVHSTAVLYFHIVQHSPVAVLVACGQHDPCVPGVRLTVRDG